MNNVHPGIASLTPYAPGKPVDELARELGLSEIIKLASNENPMGPSAQVQAAMAETAAELTRYPDGSGYLLKQAIAERFGVATDQLTLGNGSNDVLDLVARVAVEPGCETIVSEHAFVVYRIATACVGGTLVEVPARNYTADLGGMLQAVTERTRVVFIANPNNPTGTWVTESAVREFLDVLPERVWVVLDEAYVEYVDEPDYPNGIALLDEYPNLIVTRTFSKAYGLAALRLGFSVSSPAFADLLNRARQPFNCSSVALAGGVAALADQDYVRRSVELNRQGMAQLTQGLAELGLDYIPSIGNFLSVDVKRPGGEVFQAMLKQGVILRPIAEYGLANHIRISIGLPEENARCLECLKDVLA